MIPALVASVVIGALAERYGISVDYFKGFFMPDAPTIDASAWDLFETTVKQREGLRVQVYKDTLGHPTAGYGHKLTAAENKKYPVGTQVPVEQIDAWFNADAGSAFADAIGQAKETGKYYPYFIAALASVNFQLGPYWRTKFPNAWLYIKLGDIDRAIAEIRYADGQKRTKLSAWATQTPVRVADFINALERLKREA